MKNEGECRGLGTRVHAAPLAAWGGQQEQGGPGQHHNTPQHNTGDRQEATLLVLTQPPWGPGKKIQCPLHPTLPPLGFGPLVPLLHPGASLKKACVRGMLPVLRLGGIKRPVRCKSVSVVLGRVLHEPRCCTR